MSSFKQIKQPVTLLAFLLVVCMLLTACGSRYGGKTYSGKEVRRVQTVEYGTVKSVSLVTIRDDQSGLGVLGGALVGGVLGSFIGGGSGRVVGAVGGAVVGGLGGAAAEEAFNTREALEITVDLDKGNTIVVVQENDEEFFTGDKVRVLRASDGSVRVRR